LKKPVFKKKAAAPAKEQKKEEKAGKDKETKQG